MRSRHPIPPLMELQGDPRRLSVGVFDLNGFFASVEQQCQAHLRGRPVGVVPMMSDGTCIIASSYEAKAFGIKTGTPVWEARQRCPGIALVEARHEMYMEYHNRIFAVLQQHAVLRAKLSIDEASFWVPHAEPEAARAFCGKIKASLAREVGEEVRCSIGISSNPFLAKIGTDMQKPDGMVVLYGHEVPDRLGDTEITFIPGIGANMDHRLRMKGIGTIGELWAKSPTEMRRLWGSVEGERLWHKLHGYDLPERESEKSVVGHSHVLEPVWRPFDRAEAVARRLLLKAGSRLRRYGYHASMLEVSARIDKGPGLWAAIRFSRAYDNATLQRNLTTLWARLIAERPDKPNLKKLSVQLHGLSPADHGRAGLFDAGDPVHRWRKKQDTLSFSMDDLNRKFGRDSIVMGFLPRQAVSFAGTKIAFTRIPEMEEFHE